MSRNCDSIVLTFISSELKKLPVAFDIARAMDIQCSVLSAPNKRFSWAPISYFWKRSMKELVLQRRKLLFYLDLDITGVSITNGCGIISKGVSSTNQTTSASTGTTTASNDFETWNAYSKRILAPSLPCRPSGFAPVMTIVGEGAYDTTEQTIRQLLG
jgi:hypothetical protein